MAKKPRVKAPGTAKKGEVFEVKALIPHVMETGLRKDNDGKVIPRQIINKFECKLNGNTIFAADLFPSIAANPYISFYCKATESGEMEFIWTEDGGEVTAIKQSITVS